VLDESISERLRRESNQLLESAAELIEHAATLKVRAAELQKQISRLDRNIPTIGSQHPHHRIATSPPSDRNIPTIGSQSKEQVVVTIGEGKRLLLGNSTLAGGQRTQAGFPVHPTHCKAVPRGVLTSPRPFPYSFVLQSNTTVDLWGSGSRASIS